MERDKEGKFNQKNVHPLNGLPGFLMGGEKKSESFQRRMTRTKFMSLLVSYYCTA
jgi:hypothetical protein